MSRRRHLEKLVRGVVHQGVQLAAFDRLLRGALSEGAEREVREILRHAQSMPPKPVS